MPDTVLFEFECSPENAPKFWKWIHKRGGIAKWKSVDLSDPGKSWSSPVRDSAGVDVTKPSWKCENSPSQLCTNPDMVSVTTDKEVQRFRVTLRSTGPFGATTKCTDASSRKIRQAVEKWTEKNTTGPASYYFDYETQEVVITVPDEVITLSEWAKRNPTLAEQAMKEP